ncbi:peptidoglycan-binding protein [Pseudomonas nitroreducens]|uniref:peptidoglycan-binding domain-containing protein n=1 Tax=Pseudomonas nitroreducens TaxID=46680 RepID=UPI0038068DA3
MASGQDLYDLAETKKGQKYVNLLVPKDNPNWNGPWDCAEFVSWVVYQKTGKLYGCVNNKGNPATTEAYSGAWVTDAKNGTLLPSDERDAMVTSGVILIRKPPMPGAMGHVAISNGAGKTMEAAGTNLGVRAGNVSGRVWDYFCRIPGITYSSSLTAPRLKPLPKVIRLEDPNVKSAKVKEIQKSLKALGIDPGKIDGEYGPHTVAAVVAFQKTHRLVADGVVGPATARALKIDWP